MTYGEQRLINSLLPDLIRKLQSVSEIDIDGLTKSVNRLAKAQEEANKMAREQMKKEVDVCEDSTQAVEALIEKSHLVGDVLDPNETKISEDEEKDESVLTKNGGVK